MSSPILPVDGPSGPTSPTNPTSAVSGDFGFMVELTLGKSASGIHLARGGPPPEVLEQIDAARRIEEQLRESGQHLRFSPAPSGGRTTIAIHDRDGNATRTLSIPEAFALAAGNPLG
jgi:hypothetical protein